MVRSLVRTPNASVLRNKRATSLHARGAGRGSDHPPVETPCEPRFSRILNSKGGVLKIPQF